MMRWTVDDVNELLEQKEENETNNCLSQDIGYAFSRVVK